jgi:hypothetical protein
MAIPELDPAWAVRPLALTQYQGRTLLLLDDPGGESLDLLLAEPMELRQVLRLAIGLAEALTQSHGRCEVPPEYAENQQLLKSGTN